MILFKTLSALLAYPEQSLLHALPEIAAIVEQARALSPRQKKALAGLVDELAAGDPIDLQERYVAMFDRGRATSLHLFEHVHGESRERGSAMVDLKQVYARAGLQLRGGELPDYLPALLEFISLRPHAEGIELLEDCAHILRAIGDALQSRQSRYSAVFAALLELAGEAGLGKAKPVEATAAEEDLDRQWVDEPVIFGPAAACGEAKAQVAPVHFHPRQPKEAAPAPPPGRAG